jgi:hypothetical protein
MQPNPHTPTENPHPHSADLVTRPLNKALPAAVVSHGKQAGRTYVIIRCSVLEAEFARLHRAGLRRLKVVLKAGGNVVELQAKIIKKTHGYFLCPLGEAQKFLSRLYEQERNPERKRNPVVVLILDVCVESDTHAAPVAGYQIRNCAPEETGHGETHTIHHS